MNQWKIVDSFGSIEDVARLAQEAITMASATGSVGSTVRDTKFNDGELITTAMARVEKIRD